MEKPKYFDSWKGKVDLAIVEGARTWDEIREHSGLSPRSFNRVLAEMLSSNMLDKLEDGSYRLEYDMYKNYQSYLRTATPAPEPRITPGDREELISEVGRWLDDYTDSSNSWKQSNHVFVSRDDLANLTLFLVRKARREILIVNPFVGELSITDRLRERSKEIDVRLITQDPMDHFAKKRDKKLDERGSLLGMVKDRFSLYFNQRVHTKLIVIDRSIAVVGSQNFTHASTSGKSIESAIVTCQGEVVEDVLSFWNWILGESAQANEQYRKNYLSPDV